MQTPILWSHGIADRTVLFGAGQAGPPFLEQAGMSCEFKVVQLLLVNTLEIEPILLLLVMTVLTLQAYPDLGHSISNEELLTLESWIKSRLQSSS